MSELLDRMWRFSQADVIAGPFPILWLAKDELLTSDELTRILTVDELDYAKSIKAARRRDEYLRSRWLIRRATGYDGPLPRKQTGEPSWPEGYVGSISHKDGVIAFALASKASFHGIGIDIEDPTKLKLEFESKICLPEEGALLDRLTHDAEQARTYWLAVIFSLKEALFKAHFPMGQTMFYFQDAMVTHIDPINGHVEGRLMLATSALTPRGSIFRGHFSERSVGESHYIFTTVAEPV